MLNHLIKHLLEKTLSKTEDNILLLANLNCVSFSFKNKTHQ